MPNSTVSVIMPFYNEQGNLAGAVNAAVGVLSTFGYGFNIILVNDGSNDGSNHIASMLVKNGPRIRLLTHEKNRGWAAAVKLGLQSADGDYILIAPSDGQFRFEDLFRYFKEIKDSDVVCGYRVGPRGTLLRKISSKLYNLALRILFGLKLKDADWVKLYRGRVLRNLQIKADSALIDAEIMIRLTASGAKINQIPVRENKRIYGSPSGVKFNVILKVFRELFLLRGHLDKAGP